MGAIRPRLGDLPLDRGFENLVFADLGIVDKNVTLNAIFQSGIAVSGNALIEL